MLCRKLMIYQKMFLQIAITGIASQNKCEIRTQRSLCLLVMVLVLCAEFWAGVERGLTHDKTNENAFSQQYFLVTLSIPLFVCEINSRNI